MAVGGDAKAMVLKQLAAGGTVQPLPKNKARIGPHVVHIRFRSTAKGKSSVWSFNVNPNTLSANYELWVCGTAGLYYLIPVPELRRLYDAPEAYVDYQHPEIRVLDLSSSTHECTYGRGVRANFSAYLRATLPQ